MSSPDQKTFVKFIRTRRGAGHLAYHSESITREVASRDLKQLEIPSGADFFYFFDKDFVKNDAVLNPSKLYVVADKIVTREEAKLLIAPDPAMHAHIGWDPRLEKNDRFAVTDAQTLEPVGEGHIVIDRQRRQLWPELPPAPPAPPPRMELGGAVEAPPRACFRPKPPRP